jgi:hypothetical protein
MHHGADINAGGVQVDTLERFGQRSPETFAVTTGFSSHETELQVLRNGLSSSAEATQQAIFQTGSFDLTQVDVTNIVTAGLRDQPQNRALSINDLSGLPRLNDSHKKNSLSA